MPAVVKTHECALCVLALFTFVARDARGVTVDSPPAAGLAEAKSRAYLDTSDEAIIMSFVRLYYEKDRRNGLNCALDSSAWEGDNNEGRAAYIAAAGAVLYVLADHGYFSQKYPIETSTLLGCGDSPTNTTTQKKIDAIRKDIHKAMSEDIRRMGRVGTVYGPDGIDADFDMALHGLAHLMYLFQDDPVSLPTDIIYRILCMGDECKDPPDHFHKWGGSGGFLLFDLNSSGKNPYNYYTVMHQEIRPNAETENHVLSIYLWNYLATNLVMKLGKNNPNPGDARYHDEIRRWYLDYRDQVLFQPSVFYGDMLRILGRVIHNGFFEHNSRPYQKYSISGILTAAIYGFLPDVPDELYEYMMKVRQAARNAVGYAATAFAFQALRGKRSSPWRRKNKKPYHTRLDFYSSNLGSVIFGLMSGAREWNACSDDWRECRQLNYRTIQSKSWVLWPSLARHKARRVASPNVGYELPEPIHGLMFDEGLFFSRMQTRFTEGIYQRNHFMKPYFVSDYDSYLPSDESWESTPELYFRTEDLMLAAGGQWERYYEDRIYKDYNVVARPTMLFGRGDFGHRLQPDLEDSIPGGWLWRQDHDHATGDALQNVMLVPGKRSDFFESTCNVWIYRNFNYGYRYHDSPHLAPGDWYEGYPQRTPDWWSGYLEEEFSVQTHRDRFQIYEFPAGVLGDGTG